MPSGLSTGPRRSESLVVSSKASHRQVIGALLQALPRVARGSLATNEAQALAQEGLTSSRLVGPREDVQQRELQTQSPSRAQNSFQLPQGPLPPQAPSRQTTERHQNQQHQQPLQQPQIQTQPQTNRHMKPYVEQNLPELEISQGAEAGRAAGTTESASFEKAAQIDRRSAAALPVVTPDQANVRHHILPAQRLANCKIQLTRHHAPARGVRTPQWPHVLSTEPAIFGVFGPQSRSLEPAVPDRSPRLCKQHSVATVAEGVGFRPMWRC